jgi:Domain of unknown function (DUF6875)
VPDVVELMNGYKSLFLEAQPTDGDDANYKVIVVVFTDLPSDRAQGVFGAVLQHLAVQSFVEDGILFGPFYEGNEGTAIYKSGFRSFQSPVPFLFVRHGVISDWKFFLDNEDWLDLWARRLESPEPRLLLRNCAACRGARIPSRQREGAGRPVRRRPYVPAHQLSAPGGRRGGLSAHVRPGSAVHARR